MYLINKKINQNDINSKIMYTVVIRLYQVFVQVVILQIHLRNRIFQTKQYNYLYKNFFKLLFYVKAS